MTPVLLVGFNRPDAMAQTAQTVGALGYDDVYLAVDGPREGTASDAELNQQTIDAARDILGNRVSDVLRQSRNLGCATAVPTAIDWFFEHVASGLILEDDCVPSAQAAEFVASGLTQYRASDSVYLVSCASFTTPHDAPAAFLTRFPHLWGWATWRHKWHSLRLQGQTATRAKQSTTWRAFSPTERRDWARMLRLSTGDSPTTWDYGLLAQLWSVEGLALAPSLPLTRNVGFGPDATHAVTPPNWYREADSVALQEFAARIQSEPLPTEYIPQLDRAVRRDIYSPPIASRIPSRIRRVIDGFAGRSVS